MSLRSSIVPLLVKRDLELCTDVPSVFTLFHKLRYPVERVSVHVPLEGSDLSGSLRDGIMARYPIAQIGGTHPGGTAAFSHAL